MHCLRKRCSRPVDGNGPIGVLALQGNVSEHIAAFESAVMELGSAIPVIPVRKAEDIPGLVALAMPGGESTTIMRLIDQNRMRETIRSFQGGIFATCAGMVIAARELVGETRFVPLDLVDITVNRNAFGRQRESFEADLPITGMDPPFHAIFIRAPVITQTGPDVTVLAKISQGIVAVRSGKRLILSFHPEISHDLRMHQYFLTEIMKA